MVRPIRRSLVAVIVLALCCCALVYNPAAHSRSITVVTQKNLPLAGTFDVKKFGAKGDGKALDSPSINRAIDAAAAAGGGTVFFPAGIYRSFSIRLKSNVGLYISHGATVLAAGYTLPVFYLLWSLKYGRNAGPNPWGATGLEWQTPSPPPPDNFPVTPVVTREPYAYAEVPLDVE